jgi:hypothetical protein
VAATLRGARAEQARGTAGRATLMVAA